MNRNKCLCCYQSLKDGEVHYHAACARKLFGSRHAPILLYSRDNIDELALDVLKSNSSVTGVQAQGRRIKKRYSSKVMTNMLRPIQL